MTELMLKGGKMATQKKLKLVIITIISVSMATNIQARLIEPTITTTMVSQTPYPALQIALPFSVGQFLDDSDTSVQREIMPLGWGKVPAIMAFTPVASTTGSIGLFDPDLDVLSASSSRTSQDNDVITTVPSSIAFEDLTWVEDWAVSGQPVSELQLSLYPSWGRETDPFCPPTYVDLAIPSSLNHTYIEELEKLNELSVSLYIDDYWYPYDSWSPYGSWYPNDFWYSYGSWCPYDFWYTYGSWCPYDFWNRIEHFDEAGVTISPEGNTSLAAIPEPATILLLGFGTLVFVAKRR
jgi:hypothetical protein